MDYTIRIVDGVMQFIYDDALSELQTMGEATTVRVSEVEPHPDGGWTARMLKDNVVLGPFPLRAQALEAERWWLSTMEGL